MDGVEFQFMPRQANKLTYNIARHARYVSKFTVWMENVPPHLVSVIQADSAIHQKNYSVLSQKKKKKKKKKATKPSSYTPPNYQIIHTPIKKKKKRFRPNTNYMKLC